VSIYYFIVRQRDKSYENKHKTISKDNVLTLNTTAINKKI